MTLTRSCRSFDISCANGLAFAAVPNFSELYMTFNYFFGALKMRLLIVCMLSVALGGCSASTNPEVDESAAFHCTGNLIILSFCQRSDTFPYS